MRKSSKSRRPRRNASRPRRPRKKSPSSTPTALTGTSLAKAILGVSWALERAPEGVLVQAHDIVYQRFMKLIEDQDSRDNHTEQRILGSLWAELETAIDERRLRH